MVHAFIRMPGHGVHFFAQIERLLRMGAPVTVDNGDAGDVRVQANLVPARFPLLKRKMDRVEGRRRKQIRDQAKGAPIHEESDTEILGQFEDAAVEGLHWRETLAAVCSKVSGLVDDCGRPLTPWARRIIANGRKVHRRALRDKVEDEKSKSASPEEIKQLAIAFLKRAGKAKSSGTIGNSEQHGSENHEPLSEG
jgi:hypothetical protein